MNDAPVISLSTSYLQSRFKNGYEMLCKAAEYGFKYAELGHSTPLTAVEDILRAVKEGVIKISSLHNFCPLPNFVTGASPNLYSPATSSRIESAQWARHTKNTLDFAKETGARAVVCHAGSLNYFFYNPARALKYKADAIGYGKLGGDESYARSKARYIKKSAAKAEKAYAHIVKNLGDIRAEVEASGVLIGVENRENISELPLDWSFEKFMAAAADLPYVKAWHDVGHSMKKQLLGFETQAALCEKTASQICGWHLHDCTLEGKDHIGLGKGAIDFKALSKYFDRQRHLFVLEINSAVSEADVKDSLKYAEDLLS